MPILSITDQSILILAAFLTSVVSAILGMGGGISLLAVMMQYFPPATLIPMHGIVQIASNGYRSILNFKHINYSILLPLVIGAILGSVFAYQLVLSLPEKIFSILMPLVILYFTWKPTTKKAVRFRAKFYILGFFSSILSILFGATGPLLAPFFLNENLSRFQIIATKAAIQVFSHITKIIIYLLVGFQIGSNLSILVLMVLAVLVGTYVGTKILNKVSEKLFIILFKALISILCLRMLILNLINY